MHIIFQSLNFFDYNHTMLWAACCLGLYGFLSAGEFIVNSPVNPDIHLAVSDVQADSLVNPSSFRIHIHLVTVKSLVRNLTNCQSLKVYRRTLEQLVALSEF